MSSASLIVYVKTMILYLHRGIADMYITMYIIINIHTQVYAQNDQLWTQLEESKRIETLLQEQIRKFEQKVSDLHENYDQQPGGEEIETQLKIIQRKMCDVKSEFASIDLIKLHWSEEVATDYLYNYYVIHIHTYIAVSELLATAEYIAICILCIHM